jgi:hypothetical protein
LVVIPKGDLPLPCCSGCLCFLVVIPEGDLLLFVALTISFLIFSPKIACQAPSPSNQRIINNIQMKKSSTPTAIIETEGKKSRKARSMNLGFLL